MSPRRGPLHARPLAATGVALAGSLLVPAGDVHAQWGPETRLSAGGGDVWGEGIAAAGGTLHFVYGTGDIRHRRRSIEPAAQADAGARDAGASDAAAPEARPPEAGPSDGPARGDPVPADSSTAVPADASPEAARDGYLAGGADSAAIDGPDPMTQGSRSVEPRGGGEPGASTTLGGGCACDAAGRSGGDASPIALPFAIVAGVSLRGRKRRRAG
jgi:hypothetical protein